MAHFDDDLDELLDFEEVKIDRLLPARILQASGIPLVVFGQDALAFDDFVPNFFDLTILVPCDLVQTSVDVLQRQLPQCQVTQERDNTMMNRDGTCALPRAVRLQGHLSNVIPTFIHEPGKILIVPQSHFHFDVNDSTRTHGLISPFDPSGEPILFPTVPALLDAVIDTLFEPVDGVFHFKFQVYLSAFLSDLVHNTITSDEDGSDEDGPLDPDTGELLPAAKELLDGLKPENSSFLETFMRTGSIGVTPEVRAERASLKSACMPKQSILSLSNKTPRNTPFPPKYQEGHQTPAGGTVGNRPLHSRSFSQYHRPPPRPLLFQSIFRMLNAKKLLTR